MSKEIGMTLDEILAKTCKDSKIDTRPKNSRERDLTGEIYGRLKVIEKTGIYHGNGDPTWLCQCFCGNKFEVQGTNLLYKLTKSCGCLGKENKNRRVENLFVLAEKLIKENYDDLHDEWRERPGNFVAWGMNRGWHPDMALKKINEEEKLGPENCYLDW